jgi:DNA-directed RNA polymerase specialized sigma24 family protein
VAGETDREVAEWQAIVGRDEEAFKRWLERTHIGLRVSLRSFAAVVDVEVVVQETAILVWERASTILPDGRPAFLMRWATTVARNKALNAVTRTQRDARVREHADRSEQVDRSPADPLLRARIRECRGRLPGALRRVIDAVLADRGLRSPRESAAAHRMSYDAFRQNLARGRRALADCLREHGIEIREYLR